MSFTVELASDVYTGLGGIGGSPSGSVFLKVGGSTAEPTLLPPRTDDIVSRLNLDIGNQANSGKNTSVAGNVANDINPLTLLSGELDDDGFRLFRRQHIHPVAIKADAEGRMHLMVGTDSGFEGITRLYYKKIKATLKPISGVPTADV